MAALCSIAVGLLAALVTALGARGETIEFPALGANHAAIAFGAGSAWVLERTTSSGCGALVRLDPVTMAASGTLALRRCPLALTFGDRSVWVLDMRVGVAGYRLTRVDPATLRVRASAIVDRRGTPAGATGAKSLFVATAGTSVMVADGAHVVTLAAKTLAPVASVTLPRSRGVATAFAAGRGAAWLGTDGGWVYRIGARTGRVAGARHIGAGVLSLSASGRALWATIGPRLDTLELDPATGAVEHDTGLPLLRVATDGRDVWGILATPRHGGSIARIDPARRTIAGVAASPSRPPAFTPDTIAVGDGAAWIINSHMQTLTRVPVK